jgi:Zn-dependent protease with chaperone function
MPNRSYRYPSEIWILLLTVTLIGLVFLVTAGFTLCLAPILLIVILMMSYLANQSHHRALLTRAFTVSPEKSPRLAEIIERCRTRLGAGPVNFFVVKHSARNAYSFGIKAPQGVVLYSSLFDIMDEDELAFIIGHELGHITLGHTLITTILGGMAGIPPSLGAAAIFLLAFRWWNRACEFSSDRAGLLACGRLDKAISALVQLEAGDIDTPQELKQALMVLDKQDDDLINQLLESLATHPMIIRRIEKLQTFAQSPEYLRLKEQIDRPPHQIF